MGNFLAVMQDTKEEGDELGERRKELSGSVEMRGT